MQSRHLFHFLHKKQYRDIFIILSATLIFTILTYISRYLSSLAPLYLDEKVYIQCGIKYVSGLPPILCNFEHPPLGKYIIGLFMKTGAGMLLLVLNYFLSVLLIYKIVNIVTANREVSLYSALIIGFDTLFMFTYMHFLLDPVALTFLLGTLYLGMLLARKDGERGKHRDIVLFGILLGLTLATKWQTVYTLLGLAIIVFISWIRSSGLKRSSLRIAQLIVISAMTYLVTFVGDITLGMTKPVEQNFMALDYMMHRHGLSFPLAVIGLMKLLSRIEIWRLASFVVMYVTTVPIAPNTATIIVLNSTTVVPSAKALIRIGVGVPSLLWPILFPIYLLVIKTRLEKSNFTELDPLLVIASTSLLNVLNGPLDWYYVYVIPFLYIIAVSYILSRRRGRHIAIALILTQLIYCFLFFSGIIPYTTEVSI